MSCSNVFHYIARFSENLNELLCSFLRGRNVLFTWSAFRPHYPVLISVVTRAVVLSKLQRFESGFCYSFQLLKAGVEGAGHFKAIGTVLTDSKKHRLGTLRKNIGKP